MYHFSPCSSSSTCTRMLARTEPVARPVTDSAVSDCGAGDGDAAPSLRAGQVPPSSTDCPYIIPTEEGAGTRGRDASIPGSVIVVKDFNYARLGNRFVALGHSLSLGFCCKSNLVSTPAYALDF